MEEPNETISRSREKQNYWINPNPMKDKMTDIPKNSDGNELGRQRQRKKDTSRERQTQEDISADRLDLSDPRTKTALAQY